MDVDDEHVIDAWKHMPQADWSDEFYDLFQHPLLPTPWHRRGLITKVWIRATERAGATAVDAEKVVDSEVAPCMVSKKYKAEKKKTPYS